MSTRAEHYDELAEVEGELAVDLNVSAPSEQARRERHEQGEDFWQAAGRRHGGKPLPRRPFDPDAPMEPLALSGPDAGDYDYPGDGPEEQKRSRESLGMSAGDVDAMTGRIRDGR